jgi:hypothetical protein
MLKHACVVLLLISGSGCHSNPVAPSSSSITVTGTVPSVGQTSQLDAKATLTNGTSQDVTTLATWSSSNTAVASVTAGGLLQVLSAGSAQITATYQGVSGQFSVSQPVTSVTSVTSVIFVTSVTSVMLPTSIISATFASPVIRAGRIAIGCTTVPGVIMGGIVFGPRPVGTTACVGSTGLGDG